MSTIAAKTTERKSPKLKLFGNKDRLIQITLAIVVLVAWEGVARAFHTEYYTSTPSQVAIELKRWALSGQLATDLQLTLTEAGVGFLIGSTIGGVIGFILGWVRRAGDILEPFILSLYTMPKIALAPLFVLWFGIGAFNKIMFAALLVFFMVFFTTYQGTRQVDRDLAENARLMGAQRWDVWTKIAIPYAAVWVFTGIRIGLPYALIGAIVGEFVASQAGVGFFIKQQSDYFNTAAVFAGLIVLMLISLGLLVILKLIEKWALGWQDAKGEIQSNDTSTT